LADAQAGWDNCYIRDQTVELPALPSLRMERNLNTSQISSLVEEKGA
jgi:hypothetical protein